MALNASKERKIIMLLSGSMEILVYKKKALEFGEGASKMKYYRVIFTLCRSKPCCGTTPLTFCSLSSHPNGQGVDFLIHGGIIGMPKKGTVSAKAGSLFRHTNYTTMNRFTRLLVALSCLQGLCPHTPSLFRELYGLSYAL